jgi:alpha-ketoglutarate-dependent taurine dioxygenase
MKFGKIANFVEPNKLKNLYTAFKSLPDQENTGGTKFRAYTNGISPGHHLYDYINNQLSDILSQVAGTKISITVAMLIKEQVPWEIHTDYNKGDQYPGTAFLIPIDWDGPVNSFTHTVIFNQECTTNFTDFLEKNNKVVPNALQLKNNLCSHVSDEHLEHVSLLDAYRWNPGDLIFWDRKLLHCSDNFINQDIVEKRALVIFTSNQ